MQVLLRKDVERLGKIGEMVNVKPGYARNYLLPHGLAVTMTKGNARRVEIEKKRLEELEETRKRELASIGEGLKSASITLSAKANEEGHLFGSVNAAQIAEALQAEGYQVDEKMLHLAEPIRDIGVVEVPIQLTADLMSSCKVWVVAE